ncbi:MAG: hypothetical protein AABX23_01990 [Nanoarchaeota archaeon]
MASLKRVVVVLLMITLVLSVTSVVFNLMIYNINSDNYLNKISYSSNAGNVGLVVEGNGFENGADYGG